MTAFLFCVFLGGGGGTSSYPGSLSVALFAKGKYSLAKQKFFLSNKRQLCQIGPHFNENKWSSDSLKV